MSVFYFHNMRGVKVVKEETMFREWWGRLGEEEVEWMLDGMKRMLILDLCVLAVVGRGEWGGVGWGGVG